MPHESIEHQQGKVSVAETGKVAEVADAIWPASRIKLKYTTKLEGWQ
ncbi:MAG: hypothetical protein ACREMZ_15945 [Gemmatimonadales bacterium]